MEDGYSKISMSRKQAQAVAFAIIADIEAYCEAHQAEFEAFLQAEEEKERGDKK